MLKLYLGKYEKQKIYSIIQDESKTHNQSLEDL
jgi:hypothetical protein